jgi:uncharacterized Zn finger protein (UPF0148 family)
MKNKKKTKRKINKFCRLYKYKCIACGKEKHKRHFAKNGETICPMCEKQNINNQNNASLFDELVTA